LPRYPVALMLVLVVAIPAAIAGADCMVFCAPGAPGTTADAQSTLDQFVAGVVTAAGWKPGSMKAVYYETGPAGVERLRSDDAVVAVVTLPFYLAHRAELGLEPLLAAVANWEGDGAWSLVAARGRLARPGDLSGWIVTGLPAYHPGLVRGPVLSAWGDLPETVGVEFTGRTLSALRKASRGEDLAVLLDRTQVDALDSLPYGDKLEVVHASGPMPGSLLCAVGNRFSKEKQSALTSALLSLHERSDGASLLETIRMTRFRELDRDLLERIAGAAD